LNEVRTTAPLIQKVGDRRIVVELAGEKDPARAKSIVQRSAFLEFRIVDMQNQFRAVIPAIDAELKKAGIRAGGGAQPAAGADERLVTSDTTPAKGKAKTDTTADANAAGALSA